MDNSGLKFRSYY